MHKQPTPFDSFHRWDQSHPVKLTQTHCCIKDPKKQKQETKRNSLSQKSLEILLVV